MLAAAVALIVVLVLYLALRRPKTKWPPGPPGLPVLGNVLQVDKKFAHKTIKKWYMTYGDIFMFRNFMENIVVLSSHELIHEALVSRSNDFAGRQENYRAGVMLKFCSDIIFTGFTSKWIYTKKLAMQSLKMYGDGLANLEEISMEVINEMLDDMESKARSGTLVDMKSTAHECTAGIVSSVVSLFLLGPVRMYLGAQGIQYAFIVFHTFANLHRNIGCNLIFR